MLRAHRNRTNSSVTMSVGYLSLFGGRVHLYRLSANVDDMASIVQGMLNDELSLP